MSDLPDRGLPARRAADRDREAAARRLRDAAADGRLDLTETEQRLAGVYAAKTIGELDALTADLPAPAAAEPATLTLQTRSGSLRKRGYWRVPAHIVAECTSGSIKLDFTAAECAHREVIIEVAAKSGSVVLIVPKGWAVDLDRATTKSGSVKNNVREPPAPGAPILCVSGMVKSGSISARHPRRSFWAWLTGKRPEP